MNGRRGFTLVEMMVTLAIIGILVGITASAVSGIRPRSQLASASVDVAAVLQSVSDRAVATGAVYWVGWVPPTQDRGARLVVYKDWNGNLDPSALPVDDGDLDLDAIGENAADDEECANATCRRDEMETVLRLPRSVEQLSGDRFDTSDVPTPYQVWGDDYDAEAGTGCSFCDTGNPNWAAGCNAAPLSSGWIRFLPRGEVRVYCEPTARGGVLVLGRADVPDSEARMISITAPFGLTESFDQ